MKIEDRCLSEGKGSNCRPSSPPLPCLEASGKVIIEGTLVPCPEIQSKFKLISSHGSEYTLVSNDNFSSSLYDNKWQDIRVIGNLDSENNLIKIYQIQDTGTKGFKMEILILFAAATIFGLFALGYFILYVISFCALLALPFVLFLNSNLLEGDLSELRN